MSTHDLPPVVQDDDEQEMAPDLLEPNEFALDLDFDTFGAFNITRIWEMAEEEDLNVNHLEVNMANRLYYAYCATWGLEVGRDPIKPALVSAYGALQAAAILAGKETVSGKIYAETCNKIADLIGFNNV